jgi:hypothetical protein
LYLDTTLEERVAEFWAYQYTENPKLLDVVEDESFSMEDIQREWAEDLGEEADIYTPPKPVDVDPDSVDDWEDM